MNNTNLSDWHSFTPYPSLSPYSQTEWWTEEWIHLLRVGWRNVFSSCAVVSFFLLWREIVLGVTYLPYKLWCCVIFLVVAGNCFGLHRSVFWLWWEIVLGVTYFLSTIPVVVLCHFFGCNGKLFWVAQISFLVVVGNSFGCYLLLIYHTSCAVVSVIWLRWEIVLVAQFQRKILIHFFNRERIR